MDKLLVTEFSTISNGYKYFKQVYNFVSFDICSPQYDKDIEAYLRNMHNNQLPQKNLHKIFCFKHATLIKHSAAPYFLLWAVVIIKLQLSDLYFFK